MGVEPVPGEPAAVANLDGERAVLVADYHAGIEAGLRREGVELRDRGDARREHLLSILRREDADRLVVLGDLGHAIGNPGEQERDELEALFEAVPESVAITLVKGNHDGDVETLVAEFDREIQLTPSHGIRVGDVGLVHGHTWPAPHVLGADVVCMGHEHPVVRLEDEVGGARMERVWLRGDLRAEPFREHYDDDLAVDGELVVFPGFNDLSGGTWINVSGQEFLSPFLPDGLADGEAYLLDGTRLGDYRRV
ncbi:metallophosphoesterase [Haloarculaceae archaeon H-GB2-1]|nr:metallophosphoesterase [Haloarculaceae archaeon H-GB1-1]MEA5386673.1 metallophosphoesterase [Haloarculaceae archaeon H-GB11]MEA5408197.1 metallophosphoesterase [Haloarculaceae archaeon H-GB2-1]